MECLHFVGIGYTPTTVVQMTDGDLLELDLGCSLKLVPTHDRLGNAAKKQRPPIVKHCVQLAIE
jgi:hypothetical protein